MNYDKLEYLPMNLRFLRTFVAIADNAGFARAAGRLNLTQSAASRQIQALEDELGLRLFARIGRSARLTAEGEDLLVPSRRLLSDAEALGARASARKLGEVGVLRVGSTPQVIENLLAEFLPRYRKRHPGIEVPLVEDGGARLPGRLERGDLDVAIMPAGEDRFSGRLLYPMHVLAVLPQKHRLGRRQHRPGCKATCRPKRRETPRCGRDCQLIEHPGRRGRHHRLHQDRDLPHHFGRDVEYCRHPSSVAFPQRPRLLAGKVAVRVSDNLPDRTERQVDRLLANLRAAAFQ